MLVRQADLEGASPGQISLLANNLNLALGYEDNATLLFSKDINASNFYASKSVSLSNATSAQALSLTSAARTQTFLSQVAAYSIAVAAGFGSALFVLELDRLDNLVRRMRLRRTRLNRGVKIDATKNPSIAPSVLEFQPGLQFGRVLFSESTSFAGVHCVGGFFAQWHSLQIFLRGIGQRCEGPDPELALCHN